MTAMPTVLTAQTRSPARLVAARERHSDVITAAVLPSPGDVTSRRIARMGKMKRGVRLLTVRPNSSAVIMDGVFPNAGGR